MNKYQHRFNNINFSYYIRDDVDFSVFNEVFKFNEYKSSTEKIINSKNPIIDIGAHVGFFSIFAHCLNSDVKIYSVEPEKSNFELLNKHKDENGFNNIKTFKCAIGESTKTGELLIAEDSINHKISKIKNSKLNMQSIRIFSLRDFLIDNKISKVSLVKMDIEGGEYDIFESLEESDFANIESFILEYHEKKPVNNIVSKRNKEFLMDTLRLNGFSVQLFPSRFDKDLGFIFALNKRMV